VPPVLLWKLSLLVVGTRHVYGLEQLAVWRAFTGRTRSVCALNARRACMTAAWPGEGGRAGLNSVEANARFAAGDADLDDLPGSGNILGMD